MAAAGVCHSDLHVVDGEWERPANVVLGHEGAAIVERLELGDRDVSAPLDGASPRATSSCSPGRRRAGRCASCRRQEAWLCATPAGAGIGWLRRTCGCGGRTASAIGAYSGIGTFGERQVVAQEAAIPIDPSTPPEIAALIGCAVTTGIGAVLNTARVRAGRERGRHRRGRSRAVGRSWERPSRAPSPIIAVDTQPSKLELARQGGRHARDRSATEAVTGEAEPITSSRRSASGRPSSWRSTSSGRAAASRSVGMTPQGERAGIDVYRFVEDGKMIRGSNYGSADACSRLPAHRGGLRRRPSAARPADHGADRPRGCPGRARCDAAGRRSAQGRVF